ncbi:hypothetical protein CsSME_00047173 [Camellia sinensis var. sinensis]
MHQTQARQVHKELQDTIAQLEAIRHEIRTVSFMNPGPLTRRLVDNLDQTSAASGNNEPEKPDTANRSTTPDAKVLLSRITIHCILHSFHVEFSYSNNDLTSFTIIIICFLPEL